MAIETPVAFFIFRRPEQTAAVFARIREARPRTLLVVADGPRNPEESEACAKTRAVVTVDWDCQVLQSYAETNMGCRRRVSSGIDWVFSQVQEAIILEDDCLPHPDFFPYCAELLDRYRDDPRVAMIGGSNFQFGDKFGTGDYYFSRYIHIWGWATWRRAWQDYDVTMARWDALRRSRWLRRALRSYDAARYYGPIFDSIRAGQVDTWDRQWQFAVLDHQRMTIIPQTNLVSNIGFGEGATSTFAQNETAMLPASGLSFPLTHPPDVSVNESADHAEFERLFRLAVGPPGLFWNLRRTISGTLPLGLRQTLRRLLRRRPISVARNGSGKS